MRLNIMSKSVLLTIVVTILGLITIAVGLYALSITPAHVPSPQLTDIPETLVMVPQVASNTATDIAMLPVVRGDEVWCEKMMLVSGVWVDADASLFAKNCIYE